jgi:hypothetical protein
MDATTSSTESSAKDNGEYLHVDADGEYVTRVGQQYQAVVPAWHGGSASVLKPTHDDAKYIEYAIFVPTNESQTITKKNKTNKSSTPIVTQVATDKSSNGRTATDSATDTDSDNVSDTEAKAIKASDSDTDTDSDTATGSDSGSDSGNDSHSDSDSDNDSDNISEVNVEIGM